MGKLKKLEEELKFYLMVFLIAGIFFVCFYLIFSDQAHSAAYGDLQVFCTDYLEEGFSDGEYYIVYGTPKTVFQVMNDQIHFISFFSWVQGRIHARMEWISPDGKSDLRGVTFDTGEWAWNEWVYHNTYKDVIIGTHEFRLFWSEDGQNWTQIGVTRIQVAGNPLQHRMTFSLGGDPRDWRPIDIVYPPIFRIGQPIFATLWLENIFQPIKSRLIWHLKPGETRATDWRTYSPQGWGWRSTVTMIDSMAWLPLGRNRVTAEVMSGDQVLVREDFYYDVVLEPVNAPGPHVIQGPVILDGRTLPLVIQ
ncbi:hypothetical protein COX69_00070 [Candidatus Falkowbacteria bacterium CG_4_10_14_0_2_um_filter_48_10]|uniref:Uncharacterized protein n=1 Tax=Candidatus Falkowbacteria bacterium CG23_combo_of_CG06-09_8_20_14_all_49_15 TaxID=1974572 RepID=A0A2G9ZNE5_9BACT|nr:MAG: hypothetical protein COX22_00870 [Candidatus Falkowbacteria bacterium CG23_combo_of_CG06-09_8_20_14_all_49_15]PJA09467.1 MAG: hypothetical protein COX69_00070 [Candidatus Falkowbacteria bacterium CG_4_10_14_0_2_um_filter_48_10]